MPRFYFLLRTPKGLARDEIGLELAGVEAAYLDACRAIPDMSAALVKQKRDPLRYGFEIADAAGQFLMEVPFSEMLDRGRKPRWLTMPALAQKAQAEMERTVRLIASIMEEREALQASLRETQELVARARQVRARSLCSRQV